MVTEGINDASFDTRKMTIEGEIISKQRHATERVVRVPELLNPMEVSYNPLKKPRETMKKDVTSHKVTKTKRGSDIREMVGK